MQISLVCSSLPLVGTSDLFEDTTNSTWIRVLPTTIKTEDSRRFSITANCGYKYHNMPEAQDIELLKQQRTTIGILQMGNSSSWRNTVLFQQLISTEPLSYNLIKAVEFDSLSVNGISLYGEGGYAFTAPTGSVLASSVFDPGASAYPYAYTLTN